MYTPPPATAAGVPSLTAAYDVRRFVGSALRMYTSLGRLEHVGVVETSEYVECGGGGGEWRVTLRLTAVGATRSFFEDAFREGIFVAPAHQDGTYSGLLLVWHSLCPGSECLERYTH